MSPVPIFPLPSEENGLVADCRIIFSPGRILLADSALRMPMEEENVLRRGLDEMPQIDIRNV